MHRSRHWGHSSKKNSKNHNNKNNLALVERMGLSIFLGKKTISKAKKGTHINMYYRATVIKQFNTDKGLGR